MSDSKQRYSDSSRSYIGNDVPGSMVDQGRYDRSKDREARWNESWKRQPVDLNDIVSRFTPGAQGRRRGVKYVFENARWRIDADMVAGYLRIYDKRTKKNEVENTIYELLLGESKLEDCIIPLNFDNLSLIPSNVNLAGAEIELIGVEDKEFILKNAIDQVRDQYDFIIIDCPPSLNMLTINAMTTADTVLVPIQCEYYALEGLSQLMHTIELVQERLNPELEMEGVVFTMYDARTNLSLQVVENVKDSLDQNIYKTIIPRNVRLAEAPSYGMPINYYDKRSTGAESYRLLADEVIHRGDEE